MASPVSHQQKETFEIVATGATTEALAGSVAVVLTALGLSGRFVPMMMAAIATVVIGGALLLEGIAVGSRIDRLAPLKSMERTELAFGMSAEFAAGGAGIILGVWSLFTKSPMIPISVAIIAFGAGLLLGSAGVARINAVTATTTKEDQVTRAARVAVSAAAGAQALVAIAACVLGILVLTGYGPVALALAALLAIGGSLLLSGGAVSSRIRTLLTR